MMKNMTNKDDKEVKEVKELTLQIVEILRSATNNNVIEGVFGEISIIFDQFSHVTHNEEINEEDFYEEYDLNKNLKNNMNKVKTFVISTKSNTIKFETNDNVKLSNLFNLIHNYKENNYTHSFECVNIEIGADNQLIVEAKEVGYYARRFDKIPELDIRTVVGLDVVKITDIDQIRKINEASCWC